MRWPSQGIRWLAPRLTRASRSAQGCRSDWLLGGDIRGKQVLCLAAGGGRHSSLYASAGAVVTVVDLSPAMLDLDRAAAKRNRHDVRNYRGIDDRPSDATTGRV